MNPDNKDELNGLFDAWAKSKGIPISKGDVDGTMTLDTTNFDALLPPTVVDELIDLTIDQSQFMKEVNVVPVSSSKHTIPIIDWTKPTWRKSGENLPLTKGSGADTTRAPYETQEIGAIVSYTPKDIREAAAAGIDSFDQKLMTIFAKQTNNDFVRMMFDGDKTLDPSISELNQMLSSFDGIHVLSEAGNVVDASAIAAYGRKIHRVLMNKMPVPYDSDPGLKWLMSRRTSSAWYEEIEKLGAGSVLADAAIATQDKFSPAGIPSMVVPQLRDNLGVDGVSDLVVDDTDGTITATVDTLLGGAAAGNAGRTVRITLISSGLSETLTVTWDATNNKIATTTSLGQATISEVEADYVVTIADETTLFLMNPQYIYLVLLDQWRTNRKYNEEYDRWEIRVRTEGTLVLPIPQAIVKAKRLIVPIVNTWDAAA